MFGMYRVNLQVDGTKNTTVAPLTNSMVIISLLCHNNVIITYKGRFNETIESIPRSGLRKHVLGLSMV